MKRLIDVDELIKYFDEDLEGYDNREYILQTLDVKGRIERVEAIPVDWINSYTTGLIFSDDYIDNTDSIDYYIDCIKEMVRDWEKENEANAER